MDFDLSEEQRMWRSAVHEFVSREVKPSAQHSAEAGEFNWTAVRKMGPLGMLGLNVPEQYDGAGVDTVSAAIAIEELGWADGSLGLAIAAHNGLGCAPIALFGRSAEEPLSTPSCQRGGTTGRPGAHRAGSWFRPAWRSEHPRRKTG